MKIPHIPVLLNEVNQAFKKLDSGYFLDCTVGFGGHSESLLKNHPNLKLIACDQDKEALEFSKKRLHDFQDRTEFVLSNFSQILDQISHDKLNDLKGILADIGVSSYQLDDNKRGFNLHSDFLDMRMNQDAKNSAFDIINNYTQEQLSDIFKKYGELNDGYFIAQKICQERQKNKIKSAKELYEIIGKTKQNHRKISKATLVFQAIRIEVNQELEVLKTFLEKLEKIKLKNCILAIICFHSLEDRIVKNYFKKWAKNCICDERAFKCECGNNHALGQIISKKAIVPSKEEIMINSRSSCAKMRIFHFKNMDK
ncbi:TPA: 16S rRNA (cytosine(1402)-N(4))-methyltransferase RsmH [Campylobacter coli]|uniref:16S rRNA (cytosine(1402)-N(4))-methyltransferase RsmH n=1 Tax=Campylobacter coli TaxID=195 RepID=UPI0005771723|nr:16S rRNA (cytosine(1402)-N(4))-methyltransferase RsmH [Campylobacter coli]MCW1331814.1 16S rRNA (cytosine(1402)-N(4))-methyltransferase RsmH [Campylobacter jejuni]EAI6362286.1 16S rRNA (cytosine(1402)-N(4))-methyltransferase RsmH [Campylobacter coli]OOX93467.1 16S rRNA (cytosine(1402)-N(4))-methyltransferase [Campylobacter coli]OOX95836.1 16S rRNA (cytosine(1402)-N(4))-methyltransferase [Campylobacter coli]OOX97419.1 16S rRNA (cytosine(1402)-N(4))-methyltransferase [Campylobacter coli]